MNGAPQLFFSCRAPRRRCARPEGPPAASSGAQSKKIYRRGLRTGARSELVRVPVPGKSAVRVPALRFFLAGRQEFIDRQRGARASGAGPSEFVFCGRLCKDKRWANSALARPTSEGKSKNSPCPTSRPPFDPRQGSAVWLVPQRPARRLPNALAQYRQTRLPIRRLLVPKCSLKNTAGDARAPVRALFADHQGC